MTRAAYEPPTTETVTPLADWEAMPAPLPAPPIAVESARRAPYPLWGQRLLGATWGLIAFVFFVPGVVALFVAPVVAAFLLPIGLLTGWPAVHFLRGRMQSRPIKAVKKKSPTARYQIRPFIFFRL